MQSSQEGGRREDLDLRVQTVRPSMCFVLGSIHVELGSGTAAGTGGYAGRGRQRSGLAGKAECRALSCWSGGAEANLCVILAFAFVVALRQ